MQPPIIKCPKCKGWHRASKDFCPVQAKIASQKKVNLTAKQDYFGESPNVFVGRYGYPDINVGILSVEECKNHDSPLDWSKENTSIQQIVDLRTQLVNANFKTSIKSFDDKLLEMSQEVSLSKKPVDVEVNLEKKPHFSLTIGQDVTPHGPNVKIKKAQVTENVSVPKKIDKLVSDGDVRATDAINELYNKGFDEHYLTKVFSVGNLGIKENKKLVPTRWSITAVDDTVGKARIKQIKEFSESDYLAFTGGYLGNYYMILVFPDVWSYELFEIGVGEPLAFSTDYEQYKGRTTYADQTAGGYYAVRLAILDKLKKMKKQASILALRFITDEYWAPLGVWVVREATRKAMESRPIGFASRDLMIKYAEAFVKKKFGMDINRIIKNSKLLKEQKNQTKLRNFL